MSELKEFLEKASKAYYAGSPIISDSQYDALEELYGKETNIGTTRGQTPHLYKMHSLRKYYEGEDIIPVDNYIITPKLDGAAIALYYVDGHFIKAVTRGDGEYGEDVSHLLTSENLNNLSIPRRIDSLRGFVQITGEIVAPKNIVNARNYAAGALGLKDPKEFAQKELYFLPYDIQPRLTELYFTDLNHLKSFGFLSILLNEVTDKFPQDGKVYRVSHHKKYEDMGYTAKFPRGAFAVKQRSEGIKTQLLDVIWKTGKSGKVTPVAILDPIVIDGATVSKATLNNPGFIEALDIEIGDFIMVERAGGIIPRIIKKAD